MTAADPVGAGRALRGAAAGVLLLEGITVLFVPRGIAQSGPGLTGARLTMLLALAVLLILASGVLSEKCPTAAIQVASSRRKRTAIVSGGCPSGAWGRDAVAMSWSPR